MKPLPALYNRKEDFYINHVVKDGTWDRGAIHQVIFQVCYCYGVHVSIDYRELGNLAVSFFMAWLTLPA